MKIEDIKLKIILDSRGQDTLEATIISGNLEASASVPSGKSTGATEVAVLLPNQALDKIPWLISQIKDHQFASLDQLDGLLITLDGTPNKSNLGGNLILALSMAFARLLAKTRNLELFELLAKISGTKELKMPLCFFNLIEGGVHVDSTLSVVEGSPSNLPFQEYLFIPQTNSAKHSLEIVTVTIKLLEEKIREKYGQLNYGDEGGFTIPSNDAEMGLKILDEVMGKTGGNARLGLDIAASTFFENGSYNVGGRIMGRDDLIPYYQLLTTNPSTTSASLSTGSLGAGYQLLSIEDPFQEEDWEGFEKTTKELGGNIWIVGDDLTTTNIDRIKLAHEKNAVNAVIIKPNQIGSVTEAINAAVLAKSYGWKIIVSHRSGETKDDFIADLAVGLGADGFKAGCPLRKERLVKYERLVEIERKIFKPSQT